MVAPGLRQRMQGPFRNGAFRRLFAGRLVTNLGDSFYFVAAMWMVYELTGNPVFSGVAGFLTLAPSALQFLAGPLVDRWTIRKTLTGTQLVQAVVVSLVPVAAYFDLLSVWVILLVMPLLATLNQLVYPAQSAALPRLLDDEDLVAANSAFSMAYQGVDMVANAVGGLIIGVVGGVALFALDAVTFTVAALLFVTVSVPPAARSSAASSTAVAQGGDPEAVADGGQDATPSAESAASRSPVTAYLDQLREGAGVIRGSFLVWLIAGAAVVNLAMGMALAAMPAYATALGGAALPDLLAGAGAYGVLMAAFAGGNLLGALGANVVDDRPLGWLMIAGFTWGGVVWTAAITVEWLPATAVLLTLAFVPTGAVNVQLAAAVQSAVPDQLVGRVSSLLGSATAAAVPIGSLAGGIVAGTAGPTGAMLVTGVAFVALAVYTLVLSSLRSLPPVANIELQPRTS